MGVVRLALRTQVPVVPSVSVGAHETLVVLARGQSIAEALRLDRLFRVGVFPLVAGPPLGIVPVGIPTLPLPAKITVELGQPIDWATTYSPKAADNETIVRRCYDELTSTMQATLDRRRRAPLPHHRLTPVAGRLRSAEGPHGQPEGALPAVDEVEGQTVDGGGVERPRRGDRVEEAADRLELDHDNTTVSATPAVVGNAGSSCRCRRCAPATCRSARHRSRRSSHRRPTPTPGRSAPG